MPRISASPGTSAPHGSMWAFSAAGSASNTTQPPAPRSVARSQSANCGSARRRGAAGETQHRDAVAGVRQQRRLERRAAPRRLRDAASSSASRDGRTLSRHPDRRCSRAGSQASRAARCAAARRRVASQTRTLAIAGQRSRTRSACTAISAASPPQPTTTAGPSSPQRRAAAAVDRLDRQRRQRRRQQRQRRRDRRRRRRRRHDEDGLALRQRPHLERRLDDDAERAVRAGEQLHQIVAGDVLHHPAAALDQRAVGEHDA